MRDPDSLHEVYSLVLRRVGDPQRSCGIELCGICFLFYLFEIFLDRLIAEMLFNRGNRYLTLEHTFLLKHEHLKPRASLDVDKKHGAEGLASSASV